MTAEEILEELKGYGNEQTKKTLMNHGAKEPFFGVKVADLKKILKKTKKNHELSLALYDTGNSDAMYLAGLMADETKITKEQLQAWVEKAYWSYLSEYTVPWVAADTPYGFELGLQWITSKEETIASAGWATLACFAKVNQDHRLDIPFYSKLLDQVAREIHTAPNRVRYTMNGFVIAMGSYISSLTEKSKTVAKAIGKVHVEMGGTACTVPLAEAYIQKVIDTKGPGNKIKTARC
jgi:3-methyladenine DNA glycosylase AlkD